MAFSGCMVRKSANQTTANYGAGAIVTWDAEAFDVGGWHDAVSNTSRLTVPSGVSYVRVTANALIDQIGSGFDAFMYVIKNGDDGATRHVNLPYVMEDSTAGTYHLNLASGPIAVSAGDYFEVVLNLSGDNSVTLWGNGSWFAIEALDSFSGCLVKKAADQTTADYSTDAAISWDTDVIDVGGWHDTGADTSRLTVPSGVSYVRLSAAVCLSSLATNTDVWIWATKNGDNVAETRHVNLPVTHEDSPSSTSQYLNFLSGPISVSAGDYFELRLHAIGDASVTFEDFSWFAIEKIA